MPRYPGGDYYLPPGTTAAPDTTIQSTPYNTFTADVETELNRQIHKDADQDAALGAISATTVAFTPTGDIAATTVQAAIVEVDTEMHAADTTLQANITAGDALKVAKAGDTMTGHLTLPAGPAAANAVRKDYVDAADATLAGNITSGDALKVAKAGDTMSGTLTINSPLVVRDTISIAGTTAGWPINARVASDLNIGLLNMGGGYAGVGVINNAGSAWMPLQMHASTILLNTNTSVSGTVNSNAPMVINGAASFIRLRQGGSTPTTLIYADGGNFYFLLTNGGDPDGSFNGLRPFYINMSNGFVTLAQGSNAFTNARLQYAGDIGVGSGMTEAAGTVLTGYDYGGGLLRCRYMQLWTNGWVTTNHT
jgi:hypothetical protein